MAKREHEVVCAFSLCRESRGVTRVQKEEVGGHWVCPSHRVDRDVDVGGWGFFNDLEVDD